MNGGGICDRRLGKGHQTHSIVHTLKGTLGNLSAAHAYEAAMPLEAMARKGDLDCVEEAFRLVQEQVERVKLAIDKVHRTA